jgi:alpha-mannosidase II
MTLLLHCVELYPTLTEALGLQRPYFSVWNVIDLRSSHNTEIALHIQTQIENENYLHTDLNGFQFIKRKTYSKVPLQGNVYPMPTASFIQDKTLRFNVLTAQPLGVASLETSAIQIFLDRRLDQDDNRGMEQAMNDNILTSSRFIMFFEAVSQTTKDHPSHMLQTVSYELLNPTVKLVSERNMDVESMRKGREFLSKFPCDLRLVNLRSMQNVNEEPLKNQVGLILHRIVRDDCKAAESSLSCPNENKMLSFDDLFKEMAPVNEIESTYLTFSSKETVSLVSSKEVVLNHVQPMQIEAYRVHFNAN